MNTRIEQLKDWAATRMTDAWEKWEPEIVDSMRAYFFDKLSEWDRFVKIRPSEVVGGCGDVSGVKFTVDVIVHDELTKEQERSLRVMRLLVPTADLEPRKHTGRTEAQGGLTITRYSVLVTLRVGEITMSREYAL